MLQSLRKSNGFNALLCIVAVVLFLLWIPAYAEDMPQEISGNEPQNEWDRYLEGKPKLEKKGKDRITLKLNNVAVADVIRLIAEYANLNILIDKDVRDVMTIKLSNVTWQEAMDTILEANRLAKRRVGVVLKVAPREKIEMEEQEVLQAQRNKEGLQELSISTLTISYLPASSCVTQVEPLLSPRGSVRSNDRTNSLIVQDLPSKIVEIENLLKTIDRKVPQVLIEAKIVTMEKKALEELGVNWGGVSGWKGGGKYVGLNGALEQATGLPAITNGDVTLPSNRAVNIPASSPAGAMGLAFGKLGSWNLDVQLSALEDLNQVKILSSPKLLVLDHEAATIGQGKEVPYQSTTDYYTSTEFKKVELSLEVTPHITSSKSISLNVNLKNDHISEYTVDNLPVINTQHITTTLLLENCETAVIGGILTKENRKEQTGVPYLSRIPILGWLFKGKMKDENHHELVIFLTPEIT